MAGNKESEHSQSQHPALIVGMGGTGKQVLLNLRRMFFERYGKTTLPHVAHLWIDTDSRDITLDGKEIDFLMREVDFKKHEKLNVELQRSDLSDYYDNPDAYPHIYAWFDQRLQKMGEVRNGAGAVRSFGRLAFFHNYQAIKDRLIGKRTELEKASSHTVARNQHGVNLDNSSIDVWMVFSVAGGTGSGMFLDMAFAIRQIWRKDVNIRGMIILPSVFSNDTTDRVFANAYAALMELEHYSLDKDESKISAAGEGLHLFPVAWTKEQFKSSKKGMRGPVFDTAYLIDNKPDGGGGSIGLEDKNSLCRMLAEWIYIEYATGSEVESLGNRRRGDESNFEVSKLKPLPYDYENQGFKEIFSSRFSSLGLSKIHIPLHRTHISVQYRLARDMVEYWCSTRDIPASLDEKLNKEYLHRLRVDNSSGKSGFVRALEMGDDSDRLSNRLKKKIVENRKQFIGMVGSSDVRNRIDQWVDDHIMHELLAYGNAKHERQGALTKIIGNRAEKHYTYVINALDAFMQEFLALPAYRFEVAREALRRIRDRLLQDQENFINVRDRNRNISNRLIKETNDRLEWLDDVNDNFTRKTLIEVALDLIEKRADTELRAQITDNASELATRLANYIGLGTTEKNAQGEDIQVDTGLLKQLQQLQDALRNDLVYQLNDRLKSFNSSDASMIFQDLGEGEDEADRFYIDEKGTPITQATLAEWEKDFFEGQDTEGPVSLWDLRKTLQHEGSTRIIERLVEFGRNKMFYLRDHKVDVLERLSSIYKPGSDGYRATLQRLIDYSQPWLPEPMHHTDKEKIRRNRKMAAWVARKENHNSEHVRQFESYLQDNSTYGVNLVSTSSDRVYALSEVSGVPLMYIANLSDYRSDAYLPHLQDGEVIHTDLGFEKFQDLLIKNPDEVKAYTQTLKIFLQAVLLGIVQIEQDSQQSSGRVLNFEFIDTQGLFPTSENLGPFTVAIQALSGDNPAMKKILGLIKALVDDAVIDMRDKDQQRWYVLLEFHAEDWESFFYRFSREHAVRVQLKNLATDILAGNPAVGNNAKEWLENRQTWTEERPEGSGLYRMKR